METVYKPYHYLFALGKSLPRFTVGCSILCWLPTILIEALFFEHFYMPLFRLSLVANLTVLFIALFFSMVLHEVCGTTYTVKDKTFVKKSPYKTSLIHFENVVYFRYIRIPLFGGFGLIRVPSGSITLPFIIDGLDACIEDIRQRLVACGKQDAFDDRRIERYKLKAVINGVGVGRMEKTIPKLFKIMLGTIIGSAFIARVFWEIPLQWVIFWSFSGIVFPGIGYVLSEMIINHILFRKALRGRTSIVPAPSAGFFHAVDASRIYWLIGAITAIAYAIAGIVVKNLMAIP
jgi:hypothetical protein